MALAYPPNKYPNIRFFIDNIRALRDYGRVAGQFTIDGRNSRMDEMQAAILRTKLPHLDDWNERKTKVAARYIEGIDKSEFYLPNTVFHQFILRE
ncbi:MAG: DegT/DnrJ/EryC1/StrS family aminotransferase [Cyclobacteriaceae bacterium]